jgi:hypothetical protein
MKIFGIKFTTKRELVKENVELLDEIESLEEELDDMHEEFPFFIGQVVYDVALKNAQGRYTRTKPSREHSTITEVEVTEKNYFGLVNRFNRKDVFFDSATAEAYLDSVCDK